MASRCHNQLLACYTCLHVNLARSSIQASTPMSAPNLSCTPDICPLVLDFSTLTSRSKITLNMIWPWQLPWYSHGYFECQHEKDPSRSTITLIDTIPYRQFGSDGIFRRAGCLGVRRGRNRRIRKQRGRPAGQGCRGGSGRRVWLIWLCADMQSMHYTS